MISDLGSILTVVGVDEVTWAQGHKILSWWVTNKWECAGIFGYLLPRVLQNALALAWSPAASVAEYLFFDLYILIHFSP